MRRTRAAIAVVLAAHCLCRPAAAEVRRFALLIGVSQYQHLAAGEQLAGCANDVRLVETMLQSRFGFAASEISTLLGEAATGANIRAAMQSLTTQVQQLPEGDSAEVVFHYSGHGSQLADDAADPDESDGLDETLVPADASQQGGPEDIRDDELNAFAHAICEGGRAKLWMILDCCHSGTGTRGVAKQATPTVTRYRKLDRDVAPAAAPSTPPLANRLPPGAAALYACDDGELEPEYQEGSDSYGLLTRFLVQSVNECRDPEQLTYSMLCESIGTLYRRNRQLAAAAPTPQIEADAELLQSSVLGRLATRQEPYWRIEADGKQAVLLAGAFHGMTPGSVFEVYEHPADVQFDPAADVTQPQGESIGWVQLQAVEGASSTAEFVSWRGGRTAPERMPRGFQFGFAIERRHEPDAFDIKLAVAVASEAGDVLASAEIPEAVQQAMTEIRQPDEFNWLQLVADPTEADLCLRIVGDRAALFPALGQPILTVDSAATHPLQGGWGPFDLTAATLVVDLQSALRRIARARNLIRLANSQSHGGRDAMQIEIELLRVPDVQQLDATRPWEVDPDRQPPLLQMHTGDIYSYRISNHAQGGEPVHVTILHINSDMGIEQVLPYQDGLGTHGIAESMLLPGQSRIEGPFQCNGEGAESYGPRHTIVLATRGPNNFYMLRQDALPITRQAAERTSLEELLFQNAYFQTRSNRRPRSLYDDSWGTAEVHWTVVH